MAPSAEALRWGIVGCGDVTEKKSGPGFQRAAHSMLQAVMRRHADKASDYAKRHAVPSSYSKAEDLIHDAAVDAVYVATPPGAHLEVALQVAAAGKPCYMEKPIARSYTESADMVSAFAKAGVPLFVAYYRRAYPRYQKLKALLDSGALGELSAVHYTLRRPASQSGGWRQEVAVSGGGLFVDVGSHLLDLLDFLLGPLRDVRGAAVRRRGAPPGAPEDAVTASFLAGDGIVGTASWNFRASDSFEQLEIVGDQGRAILPEPMNGAACILEYMDASRNTQWEIQPPSPAVQEPLIQTVVDAIQSGDSSRCPSTGESALRTARYIDSILEGFYGGRGDAFWERPETWPVNVAQGASS